MNVEFATFQDLLKSVQGLPAMPIAVIDADEQHVLEGVCEATEAGYVDPILIGDETRIRNKLKTITCSKPFRIIHAPVEDAMAEKGVELIEKGEVKALMKGHIHTDEFLHPILLHHLQGKKRISHVFLADLKTYPKMLYITEYWARTLNTWPGRRWRVSSSAPRCRSFSHPDPAHPGRG